MVLNSYSKINLSLLVNSKNKNRFHNIQSYFCLISLKDRIKIKKINKKKDIINFEGSFAKFINKKNNSIKNLLILLRKLKLTSSYYSISIEKKIPVFAGLGGGTSNAVSIIRYIVKTEIKNKNIDQIEKKIGTDLKLFFYKQGFLKNLRSIVDLNTNHKFYFVLIKPSFKCSTKEIYSKVKKYSKRTTIIKKDITNKKAFLNLLSNTRNDLQSVVEKKYPKIKKLLIDIKNEKGCYFSRMTGSGSVCYGLFKDQFVAKKALNKLKNKYPNLWLSLAKTV